MFEPVSDRLGNRNTRIFFFFIQDGRERLKIVPTQKHSHKASKQKKQLHLEQQQRTKELDAETLRP